MATREEVRRLILHLRGGLIGEKLNLEGTEVPAGDLRADLANFAEQSEFLRHRGSKWPSIPLQRLDPVGDGLQQLLAPVNIFGSFAGPYGWSGPEAAGEILADTEKEISASGLPVAHISVDDAQHSFYEGLIDVVLGRTAWLAGKRSGGNPTVTVTTAPGGVQVMYTKGHFFSVGTVFGNTTSAKRIPAGIYCFWRTSETPHTKIPLHDIKADTSVLL